MTFGRFIDSAGRRILASDGDRKIGDTSDNCCCLNTYNRISTACVNCTDGQVITFIGTQVDPSLINQFFWGNNYTSQGLSADVLYYVHQATTQAPTSTITLSAADMFPQIMPFAVEGVGVTINNGCNYSAGSGPTGWWKYTSPDFVVNRYIASRNFCRYFTVDGATIHDFEYNHLADCAGGYTYTHGGKTHTRTIILEGHTLTVICYPDRNSIDFRGLLFYGQYTAPATIAAGTTIVIPNELTISPSPQVLPNPCGIFGASDMAKNWYALSEGGEMRLYY